MKYVHHRCCLPPFRFVDYSKLYSTNVGSRSISVSALFSQGESLFQKHGINVWHARTLQNVVVGQPCRPSYPEDKSEVVQVEFCQTLDVSYVQRVLLGAVEMTQ